MSLKQSLYICSCSSEKPSPSPLCNSDNCQLAKFTSLWMMPHLPMFDCYGVLEGTEGSLLPFLCASHLYPRSKYTPGAFPLTRLHFNVDGGTWQVASMQADQRLQSKCRINCFKSLLREVNEWIKRLPLFSSMLSPLLWVSEVPTVMCEPTWNLVLVSRRLFLDGFDQIQ